MLTGQDEIFYGFTALSPRISLWPSPIHMIKAHLGQNLVVLKELDGWSPLYSWQWYKALAEPSLGVETSETKIPHFLWKKKGPMRRCSSEFQWARATTVNFSCTIPPKWLKWWAEITHTKLLVLQIFTQRSLLNSLLLSWLWSLLHISCLLREGKQWYAHSQESSQ